MVISREGEVGTIEDYLSNNDKNFLNLMNSEKYNEIRESVNNNIIYQFDWSVSSSHS